MYDSLNMHSLESSLIDIMRAEQDPMKSKTAFPFLSTPLVGGGCYSWGDHVHPGDLTLREPLGAGRRQTPSPPKLRCFSTRQLIFSPAEELNASASGCISHTKEERSDQ